MLHVYSSSDHNEVIAIDSKLCVYIRATKTQILSLCTQTDFSDFKFALSASLVCYIDPFLCSHVISTSHDA